MNAQQWKTRIAAGELDPTFRRLYGGTEHPRARYTELLDGFAALYGADREVTLVSAPGRTEIGGNHTDHNRGRVVAASVQLDAIAAASPNGTDCCRVQSKGFAPDCIDLKQLAPVENEKFTSAALIRGVAAGLAAKNYVIRGFDAFTMNDVLKGSGVSSSAAFEVLTAEIFGALFNNDSIDRITQAKISQFAENRYFGKPSGLMDQLASAVGGFTAQDFRDPENPEVTPISFDFAQTGYQLCIVDTGGSHADLTCEYAAITEEMGMIARKFGAGKLSGVTREQVMNALPALRVEFGDRAVLRALHYFDECLRSDRMRAALQVGDFPTFLKIVRESGQSSFCYLQNAYPISTPKEQGVPLALMLTAEFLGDEGAYRLHGGGFGGTIQTYVPKNRVEDYRALMESVFGGGKCFVMTIRPDGSRVIG